jgi:C-terminal processing protease CtpA/Prc
VRRLDPIALVLLLALAGPGCGGQEGTIGALLGQRPDGRLFVRETPPALAAARAGLEPGDEILLIDGKDVRAMDATMLHQALSGEAGAAVKLTVVRGDAVFRATLARTEPPPRSGSKEPR